MNIYELFTKSYLTAKDLGDKASEVKITAFRLEALNGKLQNAVVDLEGQERPLLLNRTLAHGIAVLHGAETDNWVGKTITLYPEEKKWGGDVIQTIRLQSALATAQPAKPSGRKIVAKQAEQGGCI